MAFHKTSDLAMLDALVLKALALVLSRRLDFPASCYHVPGRRDEKRGAKAAVRHICSRLALQPVRLPR